MKSIVEQLRGGDRRSLGNIRAVERGVIADPSLFHEVFAAMSAGDPRVRMRARGVRWHAAQMFPRRKLTPKEGKKITALLFSWVENEASNIVRVMSLQALAEVAYQDQTVGGKLLPLLDGFARRGSPSLKSRSTRLLRELRRRA